MNEGPRRRRVLGLAAFTWTALTRGVARAASASAPAVSAVPPLSAASSASATSAISAPAATVVAAGPPTLPADIVWETNNDDPPIGSEHALRGGRLNFALYSYPLTLRLMGPNSNDSFAGWNRLFTMAFLLVQRHPVTDRFIPMMATHWSVQKDQRTIFFKLDPDARFNDGHPVTAADYVATWELMKSEHIVDPFYNTYAKEYFVSVDRIDEHTLRIVGTRPSWRPLADYTLFPTPAHVTKADADWVKRTTNQPQVAPGPYVVTARATGESVTFTRVANWWGDGKRYFRGMYNFDAIHLRVMAPERTLDYLRRGEIDLMQESSSRAWNEDYNFPAVSNGWLRRERVFVDWPSGVNGLHMNLQAPIFRNKDFRKAMQYLFNFDRLNRNLMFNEYFRQVSFFEGTEYADPALKSYAFDPSKAREHLRRAGYRRPAEEQRASWFAGVGRAMKGLLFTRSDTDDVLVNERGEKASFTLIYGSKGLERHLTVMQQEYRRAGVDIKLQLLEPGTAFERGLDRKYEMTLTNRTTGFYPDPKQYLYTTFKNATNNNDIWAYGTPEVDALIDIYERNFDFQARRNAMVRIDDIVHDEAFYIPFWRAPFIRLVHWDYLRFPDFYLPRRTEQLTDYLVYWIDPARKAALAKAMQNGTPFPVDLQLDKDYYHVVDGGHAKS